MDSYEYYLLYHQDSKSFFEALNSDSQEMIQALEKLVVNKKLGPVEEQQCFNSIWTRFQQNETSNEKLEIIFRLLLTNERLEVVKKWIDESVINLDGISNGGQVMVIIRIVTEALVPSKENGSFLYDLSSQLVNLLYIDTSYNPTIVSLLKFIMSNCSQINDHICQTILKKSFNRNDHLALQNICYFFEEIVHQKSFSVDCDFLSKYFKSNNPTARKQGMYLIKCLIHHKTLLPSDEDSFTKFIIITEALQESQHLIQPTLELIKTIHFSMNFLEFMFILISMIFTHESSLVRIWGINYILMSESLVMNKRQTVEVLNALNSTCLYDNGENSIQKSCLKDFVKKHFHNVFESLREINWTSGPFYRILEIICEEIETLKHEHNFNTFLVENLLKQTEVIPKKIKNLVIRSGVQDLYARIVSVLAQKTGLNSLNQLLINIYNMGDQHKALRECLRHASKEDLEQIITNECPENFLRFILSTICAKKGFSEVKLLTANLLKSDKINVGVACQMKGDNRVSRHHLNNLIQKSFENILDDIAEKSNKSLSENIESLRLSLDLSNEIGEKIQEHLKKILLLIKEHEEGLRIHKNLWDVLLMNLKFVKGFDTISIIDYVFNKDEKPVLLMIQCQYLVLKQIENGFDSELEKKLQFQTNLTDLIDECYCKDELKSVLIFLKNIILDRTFVNLTLKENLSYMTTIIDMLLKTVLSIDERQEFACDFNTILMMFTDISSDLELIDHIARSLTTLVENLNANDRAFFLKSLINLASSFKLLESENPLKTFFQRILTEKIIETDLMSKELQVECEISCEIESRLTDFMENKLTVNKKRCLRIEAAVVLSEKYIDQYPAIVESFMEIFAKESKKKPRYFPNSWIHRMKLHCLQSIIFCKFLTSRTVDLLVEEVIHINNQLNVTYLIEIILARHHPNMFKILMDDSISIMLKAPALKSIFAIIVMQLKMEGSLTPQICHPLDTIEKKLEILIKTIFPYTMGQNYGVRSFAQAAIVTVYKYALSVIKVKDSLIMSKLENFCAVILDSMKFKNAAKLFEVLKKDFRFKLNFDCIWMVETFYCHIPLVTKMPFEEIIYQNDMNSGSEFFVATEVETESYITADDLLVPLSEKPESSLINLQQKYLPYKYQVPGQKLINSLPSVFGKSDTSCVGLIPRSKLVVVATLISKAPNIGGLARTCEIFGAENYIIESLKLTENSEFKALSKTAEKWMKISEIKHWQLFDYLLGMKLQGYSIVGAEQSDNSVSLLNAVIPEKSVLLLGNEKEGIPPNLMSLLDLIIELPQSGVVRSFNVHVTGAIVIWEYAKQHLFN